MIKLHKAVPSTNSLKFKDKLSFNLILDISKPIEDVSFRAIYLGSLEQKNNIEICNEFIKEIPSARVAFDLDCNYIPLKKIKEDIFVDDNGKILFDNLDERLNIPQDSLFGNTSIVISACIKDKEVLRIGFIINVKYPGIPNMFLEKNILEDSESNSYSNSESQTDDECNILEEDKSIDEQINESNEEQINELDEEEDYAKKKSKLCSDDSSKHTDEESNSYNSLNNENSKEESSSNSYIIKGEEFTYEQPNIKDIKPEDRYPYMNYILDISKIYFTISDQQIETNFNIEKDSESDDEVYDLDFGSEGSNSNEKK